MLRRRALEARMQQAALESIDRKLTAVIALLARQLSGDDAAGLESVLRRGGLGTLEIAAILGKSQRAVQMALKTQGFKE
jgi:hypothetical protein